VPNNLWVYLQNKRLLKAQKACKKGMEILDREMDILKIIKLLRATAIASFCNMSYAER